MAKRNRLVVLDKDGTINKLPHDLCSAWARFDEVILTAAAKMATSFNRRHFLSRKAAGLMTREDEIVWLNLSVHAMVESKMHMDDIARVFHSNGPFMRPGLKEFLLWLKAERRDTTIRVAINSYGFVDIISHILAVEGLRDLVDDIIAMRMVFNDEGFLTGYDPDTLVVTDIKGRRSAELIARHSIDDWVGIGDSDGDAQIVPPGGKKLLLAHDAKQVERYGRHFDDHVISQDWSGPQAWLARHWNL